MFDLFRSRQKTVRYLLGALLSLVAISMVVTLVPSYGDPSSGANAQIIAEIGDEVLTITEVQQVMARELRENRIPPGLETVYVPMFVQQMVAERAVAYQAAQMGFRLTDAELAETIAALIPQLYENGKFVGAETYRAFLAQQNMTIPQFEANVRKQALSSRLEMLSLEGVIVTPQDVENEFRRQNEKANISYVLVNADKYRSQVKITPEELQQRYEQNKAMFQQPEQRGLTVYPVEERAIAATLTLGDDLLRKAYSEQSDRFRTPERVRVRHILIDTRDKSDAEKAELKKKAEGILQQIRGGADFAKLAQEHSQDFGSAQKGGDIDWVVRGQTVPEFEAASFGMKPGQVSDLVNTMFGFHIIRVDAREDARLRPFEEVKDELRADVLRAQVFDRMQTVADQLRAALTRSTADGEAFARSNGIQPIQVSPLRPSDPVPGVGTDPNFAEAIIRKQDYLGLLAVCNRRNECIARITAKTLDFATRNPTASFEEVKEVTEAEGNRQSSLLLARIAYLGDVGAVAPMLGLLGTTLGMITTFHAISAKDYGGSSQLGLAQGVSEALLCTASGLAIGIPALIFYAIFRGKVNRLISEMEAATTHLMALLAVQYKRAARAVASGRGPDGQPM
ncbi:MAG TPA: hypothetical protein DIT13_16490 [Verrucomicrobiales bacterium]|nr:hypothetical protein [Verrucomicrobiales bacterium]